MLGFLPGTALAVFGMMAGSALLTVVGGVVGGLVGGPFLSGMIDTVLRALRDEPGYWWNTYKRAWKQNWRQSLVPGALLGLFVGSWAWMLRAQAESGNTSTALWVASIAGIFVCTGFFTWLLAQVPLVDLPLAQIAKNAGLMFFGFFRAPRRQRWCWPCTGAQRCSTCQPRSWRFWRSASGCPSRLP